MQRLSTRLPSPRLRALVALSTLVLWASGAFAMEAEVIGLRHARDTTRIAIGLPAPAPFRVFSLDGPPRLVVDLEADRFAPPPGPPPGGLVAGLRAGLAAPGRARLAIDLAQPAALAEATLSPRPDGSVVLRLILAPQDPPAFSAAAGWPEDARPSAPSPDDAAPADPRPLLMIDPGHGGMDPGAVRGAAVEKRIALTFAQDLRDAAVAAGWRAELTRDDDRYLGLRERVLRAEAAGAAAFLSIHANTVARGEAEGASVFTLSATASDRQTESLALYENRADVLAGADLSGDADDVARTLLELSQRNTILASRLLGEALVAELSKVTPMLRGRAHAHAGFRVLKSPVIPSALIELGFLSNPSDLRRISAPDWRRRAAKATIAGLEDWRERAEARPYLSADAR